MPARVRRPLPSPRPPDLEVTGVNSAVRGASNRESARADADRDRCLVERAQRGDDLAFRELVERHQRRAFVVAVTLVRDEHDAREIVQEAFLRAHRNLAAFGGTSAFFTWLYRIVHNLSIDFVRRPSRRESTQEPRPDASEDDIPLLGRVDGADPAASVRRAEIARCVGAALDALPPYHRGVIVMRELEGLSYEEMARAMGVSKGTIMSRLFHARQKLQRALRDCYEEQVGPAPGRPVATAEASAGPSERGRPT
ncbi:MAG: sigma-70 family RNA polymerase sigma factor [Polyangiaceae bacterium]|nr:sigma-70 family RNA polymerase sigma factor [Polyangiaceae bacterium]